MEQALNNPTLDPLFRLGASKHHECITVLPLILSDFLLVTATLLVTPSEEWKNTCSSPSYSSPEDDVDMSRGLSISSSPLPSSSSLLSGALDPIIPHNSEATPEIERWRSTISTRVVDDNRSPYAESVDDPASKGQSRATSPSSSNTDHYLAMQHTRGIHDTFGLVALACLCHVFATETELKK